MSDSSIARSGDPSSLTIEAGTCYTQLAYDVGLSIDLDEAARRIKAMVERATIRHKHRTPRYFDYRPAPLRVAQVGAPLNVAGFETVAQADVVLHDFGAVSVTYTIPLAGPFERLVDLGKSLSDNEQLLADARRRVEEVVGAVAGAVRRPGITEFVETYSIFEIARFSQAVTLADFAARHAHDLARVLRSEKGALSPDETADSLAARISYAPDDVTIIDWDAAVLIGCDLADVRAVLEFANVELLEMRFLDQQLDDALDEAYETMLRQRWRPRFFGARRAELQRIAQLQVDAAVLFEAVNNSLKLLGDQYLARVYRLVSQRFHLAEWDASILRKLQTLESIYQKMSDAGTSWRMEALEWIIIALIAASIVIPFLQKGAGH